MNEIAKTFGFTAKEMEAIQHRLDFDSIAEALTDTHPSDPAYPFTHDEVEHINRLLTDGKMREALTTNPPVVRDIIVDCIEGSTWVSGAGWEQDRPGHFQRLNGAIRTLSSAARKIERYYGMDADSISVPTS